MFGFLATLVAKTIGKIVSSAIDSEKESLSNRRKIFYQLLEVYDRLHELQEESRSVAAEFLGYADGTRTVTRTVPKKYLKQLQLRLDEYHYSLEKVQRIIRVYDHELAGMLMLLHVSKWGAIGKLAIILPVIPQPGYQLLYPTRIPGEALNAPNPDYELIDHVNDPVIRLRYGLTALDLRDRDRVREYIGDVEKVLTLMADCEQALAEFIRTNFTLEKVL